jgi:glycosyltransferase involved in cell wall biosynthesis
MKVLMIVDNGIIGDSRVQKCAKSVSDFGNEVLLLGRDLGNPELPTDIGSAQVERVPVDLIMTGARNRFRKYTTKGPKITFRNFLAYRNEREVDNAKNLLQLRKYAIKTQKASGKNAILPRIQERALVLVFAIRYRNYSNAWKRQIYGVSVKDKIRQYLFKLSKNPIHLFHISPSLYEFESAYLQTVIEFDPDVIHAHDFRISGAGVRLADAVAQSGQRRPKVIYDAHEFLEGITGFDPTAMKGFLLNEAVATERADTIITVSEEIADLLREKYSLTTNPHVVLNAPLVDPAAKSSRSLRSDCGVSEKTPLGVYLGGLAVKRGISPVLSAMANTPELHFAFVANVTAYNEVFLEEARVLGILDRVHILPYVEPNEIVDYVSQASFGLAPYLHDINHEVSLPSKFYEYACAHLPIVGSDVKVVKSTIEKYGIGEVFIAGDPVTLEVAIKKVINDLTRYEKSYSNAPISSWTWAAQENVLREVYKSLS